MIWIKKITLKYKKAMSTNEEYIILEIDTLKEQWEEALKAIDKVGKEEVCTYTSEKFKPNKISYHSNKKKSS